MTIAEEREVKSKEERERYIQLNPEFQRIARRDKNTSLNLKKKEKKRNKGKLQYGKGQRSAQENWMYQGNISCKNGHAKGQKQ